MASQHPKSALIVVDMQNDFCPPDGSLAVTGARDILPLINRLLSSPKFTMKVATQDWHPVDHVSFASNHPPPNNKPFDSFIEMRNHVADRPNDTMQQRLWPVHCVQGTKGADFIDDLHVSNVDIFVKKGSDARVEMYSAFSDSFGNLTLGHGGVSHDLAWLFREKGVEEVFVVGVAGDYCVKYTAIDARKSGFNVFVVEEAVRCVDPNAWDDTKEEFAQQKVHVVQLTTQEVQNVLVP